MNDNLHPLFQQILKPYMPAEQRIDQLLNEIRDNNNELMDQVRELKSPAQQKYYSGKIAELINQTSKTVTTLNKKA